MASNKIIEVKHKGYCIMIRELVDEIQEAEHEMDNGCLTTLAFPREHLSIHATDNKFLKEKQIIKLIKKGIDALGEKHV